MIKPLTALIFISVVFVAQADNGKVLHDAACTHCHASLENGDSSQLYLRADRKVTSLSALQKRVGYCAVAAGVDWNSEQKQAVVNYLNSQFYHF